MVHDSGPIANLAGEQTLARIASIKVHTLSREVYLRGLRLISTVLPSKVVALRDILEYWGGTADGALAEEDVEDCAGA